MAKMTASAEKPKASNLPVTPTPRSDSVTQQEVIEKAFSGMRAAFLPQLEVLRGAPGSGSATLTKGVSVDGDYVQVTIHAGKSR